MFPLAGQSTVCSTSSPFNSVDAELWQSHKLLHSVTSQKDKVPYQLFPEFLMDQCSCHKTCGWPFLGPSAYTATGGYPVTSAQITPIDILVFNGHRFHDIAKYISQVSFCWWVMNAGQYTDHHLSLKHPSDSLITRTLHHLSSPSGLSYWNWATCSVMADYNTTIYSPCIEDIKQCCGQKTLVHRTFTVQSFHFSDKLQQCATGRHDVSCSKFSMFTKIKIHIKRVKCPVTHFPQLYTNAQIFSGYTARILIFPWTSNFIYLYEFSRSIHLWKSCQILLYASKTSQSF